MASGPSSHHYINPQMQQSGFQFQGEEEEAKARGTEAEGVVTLLIRHLPEAIPSDTLSRLFSHYGASSVCPCSDPKLRNCAFLDFKNEALAYQALRQLNGLRFLGKILSVERTSNKQTLLKTSQASSGIDVIPPTSTVLVKEASRHSTSEPIAPRLGVDYPFPSHLQYAYPPPDGNILTNIVNALIAVPRFYTQVLHLMNKMNIPAPFRMALPTPPLPPAVPAPPSHPPASPVPAKPLLADLSSSESDIESPEEDVDGKAYSIGASTVRGSSRKRRKQEAIVGPAVDKDITHEAVGLKPATLVPKEIPMIKKKNPVLQIKIAPKVIQNEPRDHSMTNELEADKQGSDIKSYATLEELKSVKLPPEEILSLPMFKNYTAGNPTSVLYVKNLAKDVVADDFYYIFGSLFGSINATKSGISVKLMQEGRMRGQAFLTFPSVELARHALNLVNGYVFKGKPMIIQFGRNPAAVKPN